MKQNERMSNANASVDANEDGNDDDAEARMKRSEREGEVIWSDLSRRKQFHNVCWTMQSKRHWMPMLKPESGNIYSVVFVILVSRRYFPSLSSFAMLTVWQNIWVFPSIRWISFTSKYFNPLNDNSNCENVLRSMHPGDIYHIQHFTSMLSCKRSNLKTNERTNWGWQNKRGWAGLRRECWEKKSLVHSRLPNVNESLSHSHDWNVDLPAHNWCVMTTMRRISCHSLGSFSPYGFTSDVRAS